MTSVSIQHVTSAHYCRGCWTLFIHLYSLQQCGFCWSSSHKSMFFSTRINIFWHIMETSGCMISESNEIYIHPTPSYKRLIRSLVRHVFLPHLTRMHTNLISECTAYTIRVRFSERKFEFSDNDTVTRRRTTTTTRRRRTATTMGRRICR